MKTILASLSFLLFIAFQMNAQNVPNPSFEEWTPSGSEPPFDWEEPTNWKSNNAAVEFSSAAITQSTDAYEGDFAVRLATPNLFGEFIAGTLVNGNPTIDFISFSVNVETGGTPLSEMTDITNGPPILMNGQYKFESNTLGDSAFVEVLLTKYNTVTEQIDTAAYGSFSLAPTDEYSYFEVNINDLGTEIDPDNIIVAFYSSNPSEPLPSGVLLVDDIGFDFLFADISNPELPPSDIQFYPNPVSTQLKMKFDQIDQEKTIEVYSLFGEKVLSFISNKKTAEMNIEGLNKGIYLLKVYDQNHQLLKTERVVKL